MITALRIHLQVDSDTLRIPELLSFLGKRVEIVVMEEEEATAAPSAKRELGKLRGLFEVPDDFDEPLPDEVLRSFEGSGDA